jgi:hypothetical protein
LLLLLGQVITITRGRKHIALLWGYYQCGLSLTNRLLAYRVAGDIIMEADINVIAGSLQISLWQNCKLKAL